MFCEKCGNNLPTNAKFCNKCGYHIPGIEITEDHNQIEQDKKSNKRNLRVMLIVLAVIILPVIGISVYDEMTKSPDSNTNSVQSTSKDNSETWKEYNSLVGNFKVLFPDSPTLGSEEYIDPKTKIKLVTHIFSSEQADKTAYIIGFINIPQEYDISSTKFALESILNSYVQNIGKGELTSSNFSKFKDYDAIDFTAHESVEDIYIKGKNFIADRSLYILIMGYKQKDYIDANFNKFVNSFELASRTPISTEENEQSKADYIDPVAEADYNEGYKSGYVDGRSSKGYLGDNYAEPATEERKDAYFIGYLDGFLKGLTSPGYTKPVPKRVAF